MKIIKRSNNDEWITIADDIRGGGVFSLLDGNLTVAMTGGKYGTIYYRVQLDEQDIKRMLTVIRKDTLMSKI